MENENQKFEEWWEGVVAIDSRTHRDFAKDCFLAGLHANDDRIREALVLLESHAQCECAKAIKILKETLGEQNGNE